MGAEFVPKDPDDFPCPCAGVAYEFLYWAKRPDGISIILKFELGHTSTTYQGHDLVMMVDADMDHSITTTL